MNDIIDLPRFEPMTFRTYHTLSDPAAIEPRVQLSGDGYLLYENHGLDPVQLPWYNGLSFRTRSTEAVLMIIHVANFAIRIEVGASRFLCFKRREYFQENMLYVLL